MDALEFGRKVLVREGLDDWQIELSDAGGYCWRHNKTLHIMPATENTPGLVLHEIAHAIDRRTVEEHGSDYHDSYWAALYTHLIDAYLPVPDVVPDVPSVVETFYGAMV